MWITVDETTDAKNNKVGNVLVRILKPNQPSTSYLIASKRLENANSETIQELVIKSLEKFRIDKNNVLMLVTDGAAYMIKAGLSIKKFCPNLLHITCLLHAFHLVAEKIRSSYPDVDKLIANTKMIFVKSPKRIKEFHKACPKIREPPQPVLTRWGTWLQAAFYYNKHFLEVKSVVSKFDPKESKSIRESQQQFRNPQVEADLRIIHENYSVLADAIEQLQNNYLSLSESFVIVNSVNMALQNLTDNPGILAAKKFNDVLNKNPDFVHLRHIKQCLSDGNYENDLQQYFAYANITSLDVERSFSQYSATFTAQRRRLNETTIEAILMMQVFSRACTEPMIWTK